MIAFCLHNNPGGWKKEVVLGPFSRSKTEAERGQMIYFGPSSVKWSQRLLGCPEVSM